MALVVPMRSPPSLCLRLCLFWLQCLHQFLPQTATPLTRRCQCGWALGFVKPHSPFVPCWCHALRRTIASGFRNSVARISARSWDIHAGPAELRQMHPQVLQPFWLAADPTFPGSYPSGPSLRAQVNQGTREKQGNRPHRPLYSLAVPSQESKLQMFLHPEGAKHPGSAHLGYCGGLHHCSADCQASCLFDCRNAFRQKVR